MSEESLDSYKLFFVEIPNAKTDYLAEIINIEDKTKDKVDAPSLQHCNSLSDDQVRALAKDASEISGSTIKKSYDKGDTLFS